MVEWFDDLAVGMHFKRKKLSRAKISSGSHLSSIPNLITLTKRPPSRRH